MNNNYRLEKAIKVVNRVVFDPKGLNEEQTAMLLSGAGCELQLEPVTIDDIEQTYLLDALVQDDPLLSAITTRVDRLDRTMRALVKSLNDSLKGTGLVAGADVDPDAAAGNGKVVGNAIVSKPRKAGLYAVISALIPVSDGQSVSIIFYAPDDNPLQITANDTLIAFRFLLNKRDITHIVAPNAGKDISLRMTTTALSNALEKNSAKFTANKEKVTGEKQKLAELQAELERTVDETDSLATAGDPAEIKKADKEIKSLETKVNNIKQSNQLLRNEIAELESSTDADSGTAPESTPADPAGDAIDQEIARKMDTANYFGGANHWYGLRNRPMQGGAQPDEHSAVLTPDEAERMFAAVEPISIRHGAIAYSRELTDKEIADFELVTLSVNSTLKPGIDTEIAPRTNLTKIERKLIEEVHQAINNKLILAVLGNRSITTNIDGTFADSTQNDVIDFITELAQKDEYNAINIDAVELTELIKLERESRKGAYSDTGLQAEFNIETEKLKLLFGNQDMPDGWITKRMFDYDQGIELGDISEPFVSVTAPDGIEFQVIVDDTDNDAFAIKTDSDTVVISGLTTFSDVIDYITQASIPTDNGTGDDQASPNANESPTPDKEVNQVLDNHLATLKRIANNEVGLQEASAALDEIGAYLEENDLVDEYEADLIEAVNVVTEMVKDQFSKVN